MRIGIFTECYWPTMNGVVVSIDAFKKDLENKGHEIFIFAPATQGFKDKNPDQVFRYPSSNWFGPKDYPLGSPLFAPSIYKKALELNLDIIHAQHSLGMISAQALKLSHQLKIPIVHTYHTLLSEYIHWPVGAFLGKWYVKEVSARFCNRCDQIVAPSESMKKIVKSYDVTAPIEVIPTGINLIEFQQPFSRTELFTKWQVPKDKKLLLYLSRIATEKNLDFLFEAIKTIAEKRQDFHLLLVGGGKELPAYQNKAKSMGFSEIMTFTDTQPKKEANRFFGAADVYVFPSITETQGIVVTEAMAAGTPSVAVNMMGPSNIIKNNVDGFLTDLKIPDFAGKIEQLLDDENLRKKMGEAAREDAKQFSTEASAQKMENLYEKLIGSNNRSE